VNWLSAAQRSVQKNLIPQFARELALTFPEARTITVCDCFQGYTQKQEDKVVLGIEVERPDRYDSHIVKLGVHRKVGNDYRGFQRCISGRPFYSRIFVNVTTNDALDDKRLAVIYENAYQFYGDKTDTHNPREFDDVVAWAIKDDEPDPRSIQRVIRQIFGDLYRWFYQAAEDNPNKALAFFERRLASKSRKLGTLFEWNEDETRLKLRRDLNWLVCGQDKPDSMDPPLYVDPFAYVSWALKYNVVPQTLVGSSHGDLHGKNILVGVQRGEAEYPAILDYGEMGPNNALIWDFVKLETELKVRMIRHLLADEMGCDNLLKQPCFPNHLQRYFDKGMVVPTAETTRWEAKRELAFAFAFEHYLACLTNSINVTAKSSVKCGSWAAEGGRGDKLQRALEIFHCIRKEASVWLGEKQSHRGGHDRWRDEYYFALAVYGMATAQFDYKPYETGFALVSAGVATAQLTASSLMAHETRAAERRKDAIPPTYQPLLRKAYDLWKKGNLRNLRQASKILGETADLFPFAVPVKRERALVKAVLGDNEAAQQELKPLIRFCRSFLDYETLSRIGRTYKDLGDAAWVTRPVSYKELMRQDLPAQQWYATGFEYYREAFEFSRHYYPGINAAFLAHFIKESESQNLARDLAQEIAIVCAAMELGKLPEDEPFWILCTEGEAMLIAGEAERAANFYEQALLRLSKRNVGMVQSSYNQLCRLYQVLGKGVVAPVVKVFINSGFDLEPGPLGDCGYG